MPKEKNKQKGIRVSAYFENLKEGDRVAIIRNLSLPAYFPKRLTGITGVIIGKQGESYIVKTKHGSKVKKIIVPSLHLKKIEASQSK
jgi:ribosomal protein L21E